MEYLVNYKKVLQNNYKERGQKRDGSFFAIFVKVQKGDGSFFAIFVKVQKGDGSFFAIFMKVQKKNRPLFE